MKRLPIYILVVLTVASVGGYTAYQSVSPNYSMALGNQGKRSIESMGFEASTEETKSPTHNFTEPKSPLTPAWVASKSESLTSTVQSTPSSLAAEERKRNMANAISDLQRLQANETPDPQQVASAIEKLEQSHGSATLQGIRLDVLRRNLELSNSMQLLATEISEMLKNSANGGTAANSDQQLLKAKQGQLEALAKQIRFDIAAPQTSRVGDEQKAK